MLRPEHVGNPMSKHGVLSFRSDLAIGDFAVGDVKYSMDNGAWRRGDVNQLLAFSVAYGRSQLLLINFSDQAAEPTRAVVRNSIITRLSWETSLDAGAAAEQLSLRIQRWRDQCQSTLRFVTGGKTP